MAILTNYDKDKSVSGLLTIRLPVINYLECEMLTLKVILNNSFSEKLRKEEKNLLEIIRLADRATDL